MPTTEQAPFTPQPDPHQAAYAALAEFEEIISEKVEDNPEFRRRLAQTEEVLPTHCREGV